MVATHDLVLAVIAGAAGERVIIIHHSLARHRRHEADGAQRAAIRLRARGLHQLRARIDREPVGQALRPFHAIVERLGAVRIAAPRGRLLARDGAQRHRRRHRLAGAGGRRGQQLAAGLAHRLGLRLAGIAAQHRQRAIGGPVGGADGVAIGLADQLRIDQDRVVECALERRIGGIVGQLRVERGKLTLLVRLAAGGKRQRKGQDADGSGQGHSSLLRK